MRYFVRLNPRAFNPLTKQVNESRMWEIEQCADKDSEKVIWHAQDVRVDKTPIRELFHLVPDKPWEGEYIGVCFRGQDNVIEIHTREQGDGRKKSSD